MIFWEFYRSNPKLFIKILIIYIVVIAISTIIILVWDNIGKEDADIWRKMTFKK